MSQAVIVARGSLAALSSGASSGIEQSGHHQLHLDAPEAVITAVRDMM